MITKDETIIKALIDAIYYHKGIIQTYGDIAKVDELWKSDIKNSQDSIDRYRKLLNKMKAKRK
jgi:hypothetical protein